MAGLNFVVEVNRCWRIQYLVLALEAVLTARLNDLALCDE